MSTLSTGARPAHSPARYPLTESVHSSIDGVNLCGYLRTESGVGAAARGFARALSTLDLPVAYVDLSTISGNRAHDGTLAHEIEGISGQPGIGGSAQRRLPPRLTEPRLHHFAVNLVCIDVEMHYAMLAQLGEAFFEDKYNIGVWWWELPSFPQKWHDRFAYYDEIWTGSSFVAQALATASPLSVVQIPPVLVPRQHGSRERGRRRLGIAPDEVVYLLIFDFNSHMQRKNPLGVIEAFRVAFMLHPKHARRDSQPVRLILKCVNGGSNPEGYARLQEAIAATHCKQQIALYDGYWPAQEVQDLMAACDVYVSLHRSEGAGLTIADAMAHGKPVIATGWSGNMDFMNAFNSFPVDYKLVALEENVGPYRAGEQWAEPNLEHAAALMRAVYVDLPGAQQRGRRGQAQIENNYSVSRVADQISRRLETIQLRRRYSSFQISVREQFRQYQGLPQRLYQLVERAALDPAPLLIISKGDEQLLNMKGWTTWHFPQNETGAYAGHYPANSHEAIVHLEALRAKGAGYLIVPYPAYWWFEHYTDFKHHLDRHYAQLAAETEIGAIFALHSPNVSKREIVEQERFVNKR